MKQENFLKYFIVLLFASIIIFTGCEKKTENAGPGKDTLQTTTPDTTKKIADTSKVMNLSGTWSGTMNERASTFKITEFKDNKIRGAITTKSRQTYTQQVEGTFLPETRTVRLSDQTHTRFMGKYSGTISEDGNTFSGTFTSNADGSTYKFNYKKVK